MGPGVYFINSTALPGIYLSPCMYMSLALIRINTVVYIAIAGKFGEVKVRQISLFKHLMKKVWRINRSPKRFINCK